MISEMKCIKKQFSIINFTFSHVRILIKITEGQMISAEALRIMHDKKITNIFVLDGTKPIGVIHIHDLLNNGVA